MDSFKDFTVSTARPLPVVILADVSGSMLEHGKIQSLNLAVREMLDTFKAEDHAGAEIHAAVILFGGSARIHVPLQPASKIGWTDMPADGSTPLGAAIDTARQLLEDRSLVPSRAYRPTLVLVTDGMPDKGDAWQQAIDALLASDRGQKAQRMAIGIGPDADLDVLKKFLAAPEGKVHHAKDARQIRDFFQFVTLSVTSRSRSASPNTLPRPSVDLEF
jgi:uncharacterized protein YegL